MNASIKENDHNIRSVDFNKFNENWHGFTFENRFALIVLWITITIARFSVQCVAGATALQSYTRVAANRVIAPLGIQTVVIVYLTFIDICKQ